MCVLEVSATRQMHSNASMLAKVEAVGSSPSLAEAGEGHHLPGLRGLEGTSLSQGLTACKQNNNKMGFLKKRKSKLEEFPPIRGRMESMDYNINRV